LFAADTLDENGHPVLPRQQPYQKLVRIHLSQGNQPDRGAFVELGTSPVNALVLEPFDDTCEQLPGTFRCTADRDGFASFVVRSESDYSGEAKITVLGRPSADEKLTISAAGVPTGSGSFEMLIEDVEGSRVRAKYDKLACSLSASPDKPFDKWPVGTTRMRKATVRASPPSVYPASIEHAPVIIESLHSEAFISLDPSCPAPRSTRLRTQLDAVGRSPAFYFCFSDVGGQTVKLTARSGQFNDDKTLAIDAEPRLLRVLTINDALNVNKFTPVKVVEVAGYDSDLNRVGFDVDLTTDNKVLKLEEATVTLIGKNAGDKNLGVSVFAVGPGTSKLTVRPALYTTPACGSLTITVQP
jgi:hypothetical protein